MGLVILFTILFSSVTVISIVLTGSRSLIGGEMSAMKLLAIILDWHFILGAFFAFLARLFFIMVNSAVYKIPTLADSSTTVTAFITSISMVFIIVANYYFLQERIGLTQGIGAFTILLGIFLITIK